MKKSQKNMHNKISGEHQLEDIESQLVELIGKRTNLLKQHVREGQEKGLSRVDPQREKRLWRVWHKASEDHELKEKVLRSIFHLLNGIAYDINSFKTTRKEFLLYPQKVPVDIDIPGPKDIEQTRCILTLAAAQSRPIRIASPVLNDPLFECMKALNQAEAGIDWDKEQVSSKGNTGLIFDRKVIYLGQDALNFYLLTLLATTQPGLCKFSGDSQLKLLDLSPLFEVVHQMGARIIPLVPGTESLPFRLEASGQIPEIITIAPETDVNLVKAIMISASSREQKIVVKWSGPRSYLDHFLSLMAMRGCPIEVDRDQFVVQSSLPKTEVLPEISYLDPHLSGYLLACPRIAGGSVRLQGSFPQETFKGKQIIEILQSWGLILEFGQERVTSLCQEGGQKQQFFVSQEDADILFPLVFALSVCHDKEIAISSHSSENLEYAVYVLEHIGSSFIHEGQTLKIGSLPLSKGEQIALSSPSSWWCMALALISLKRSNILLKNPGEITTLWPNFWAIWRGFPRPQDRIQSQGLRQSPSEQDKSTKGHRRIIVR